MNYIQQILEGWKSVFATIRYRFDDYEWWEWDRDFWEEINMGWYREYIYPYDDIYNPTISKERQLRLAQKPPTIYLSSEDFEEFCRRLDEPLDPAITKRVEKLLKRPSPWSNQ